MPEQSPARVAPVSVLGFAVGWATAIFILRFLVMPFGFLFGRTTNWMIAEGGNVFWYVSRSLLWALIAALAAAFAAIIHNEFIRRKL